MKDFLEKLRKGIANFSNFTVLLGAILCAMLGVVHVRIDCHVRGGSPLRIIAGIFWLLCVLMILKRWKRFSIIFRIVSVVVLLIASVGLLGFIEYICHFQLLYHCIPCRAFRYLFVC